MTEGDTVQNTARNVAKLEQAEARRQSRLRRFVYRLTHSWSVVIGASMLTVLVVASVLAPLLTSYDPLAVTPALRLRPPDGAHLFGTDDFGRDIFTRVLYGGRISVQVGLVSVAISCSVGTLLGLIAGYYGRRLDALIMRAMDVILAFPGILMALVIVAVLGRSLTNVMIAVGVANIPVFTRIVRGSTLAVKELDYITACRALGAPDWRIMLRHIFPNVLTPIIVIATNSVAGAIIAGAALSFLGLGAGPPTPEWGIMLAEGRVYLRNAAWVTTFPGLAIMLTVLAINLLGDGLRDVLDPRLKIQ